MLNTPNAAQKSHHLYLNNQSRGKPCSKETLCCDSDLLDKSWVKVLWPVDPPASQSARTSSLWNEERNQCARKGLLLSGLSDSAERVEIFWNVIEAETCNIPFNQRWLRHLNIPVFLCQAHEDTEGRILIMISAAGWKPNTPGAAEAPFWFQSPQKSVHQQSLNHFITCCCGCVVTFLNQAVETNTYTYSQELAVMMKLNTVLYVF